MKAKLKNGLVVDVRVYMLNSGLGDSRTLYMDNYRGITYYEDELEFLSDTSEEVTIEGWVTRSKNGKIVFSDSPECKRGSCVWYHKEGSNIVTLSDTGLFDEGILPSVTWESEPLKVKITITPME